MPVQRILVFRLSAMGDVALTVPVIRGMLEENPNLSITFVTRPFFAPFFEGIPRLQLYFPDLKGRHKGFGGLFRLFLDLRKEGRFETVIDLHNVLRTKLVRSYFRAAGTSVFYIDKGREEKKELLKTKEIKQLKHSSERYCDVFRKAGFNVQMSPVPAIASSAKASEKIQEYLESQKLPEQTLKIGFAPFATHATKIWGLENARQLMQLINEKYQAHFYLFGGGQEEIEKLQALSTDNDHITLVAGQMNLSEEIALITRMDFMLSMDSSNMHIAALTGTKTISIWGATHPAFGFYALGQPEEYSLQTPADELACRPCSVFGNKPCIHETIKCMEMLTPNIVFRKMEQLNLFQIQ
ncbi:ADP-heptose:LPS heptosyltransferase [Prolixibacter denitrificans]|uniref:Heptosyltransferase n=1 Tax=Prolixibacter denitrificans TaxID=1541063 RepID=A0A2P8CJF3_9BACT|nr:ADP-heptose:LPS heptosyltransferase [Prolixibacter denitrificans]GET23642.1 heptosyltransferase [Prolixibacter denitrificans]